MVHHRHINNEKVRNGGLTHCTDVAGRYSRSSLKVRGLCPPTLLETLQNVFTMRYQTLPHVE